MRRLGDDARRLLAAAGVPDTGPLAAVVEVWPATVGEAIARASSPRRLARDGTLHVSTTSSAWAFELSRLAPEIVPRLAAALGDQAPTALRFAPGPVPEPSSPAPVQAGGEAPEIGPEDLAEGSRLAAALADPELRALVARAAAASLSHARPGRFFC